jgi:hypothetical protein
LLIHVRLQCEIGKKHRGRTAGSQVSLALHGSVSAAAMQIAVCRR